MKKFLNLLVLAGSSSNVLARRSRSVTEKSRLSDSRITFCVLCFIKVKLSAKVKLCVWLLCVCAILPAKAVPEMTYIVLLTPLNGAPDANRQKLCYSLLSKRMHALHFTLLYN